MTHRSLPTLAGAAVLGVSLFAAPSALALGLDGGYGAGGTFFASLAPAADRFQAAAPGPNGSSYSVGYAPTAADPADRAFSIVKVLANGTPDPTFGTAGVALVNVASGPWLPPAGGATPTPSGGNESAKGVAVQADGKIVVVGQAETVQDGTKPDTRDIDVYVTRLNVDGTLDTTFGAGGVTRVDLSDGRSSTNTSSGDQAWGIAVRPNGKIVLSVNRGLDSSDNATRPDRDLGVTQLTASGRIDTTYGTGGTTVVRNPLFADSARSIAINADGSTVNVGYGTRSQQTVPGVTETNKPFILKLDASGQPVTTFGALGNGLATGAVGGPAPGAAEAYDILPQADGGYLIGAYGRGPSSTDTDAIMYRFTGAGVWDESWGPNGILTFDLGGGIGNDQIRDLSQLADGRVVGVGSSVTSTGNTDAAIFVANPDGTKDTTVDRRGAITVDLGGPSDSFWGSATVGDGYRIVASGYRGVPAVGGVANDESAVSQFVLGVAPTPTPSAPTPAPATPAPATPAPAPATPVPATPAPSPTPVVAVALKAKVTAPRSIKRGTSVVYKVKLTGTGGVLPTGKVTFKVNGKGKKTITIKGGTAKMTVRGLRVGTNTISWSYAGSRTAKPAKGTTRIRVVR